MPVWSVMGEDAPGVTSSRPEFESRVQRVNSIEGVVREKGRILYKSRH
ncbi:MAG: hypothetical protein HY321_07765 [Armatimonadetes bacterium]|nr:hypothetical protein [Armatimonadota bacterium]